MSTLYVHPNGPHMEWTDGLLKISNLNPEVKTQWTMTRAQMFRLAWRVVLAVVSNR